MHVTPMATRTAPTCLPRAPDMPIDVALPRPLVYFSISAPLFQSLARRMDSAERLNAYVHMVPLVLQNYAYYVGCAVASMRGAKFFNLIAQRFTR